jgi:hypothetical protein
MKNKNLMSKFISDSTELHLLDLVVHDVQVGVFSFKQPFSLCGSFL